MARNVLGTELEVCGCDPMTGFRRTGKCETAPTDHGNHTVCAIVDEVFLGYTKRQGNDLSSPRPEFGFPGLKPGDRWCLCAGRWEEARKAGCAPMVVLEACHERALRQVSLSDLEKHRSTVH